MRLVASLLALLSIGGLAPAGAFAAPIASVAAPQELTVMNTPAAPTTIKKTRAAKAAEKVTDIPVAVADTNTRSEEQTAPVDGSLPSTGRGEIAAMNSEGQPPAPAHSDGTDTVAEQAQPEPIEGAQAPAGESTALVTPSPETGEIEEADAAAASSVEALMEWRAEGNPPEALAGGVLKVQHIFEGWLVVSGPPEGRRRAGLRFGPTPTPLRAEDLTSEQLAALYADPLLTIRAS